MTSGDTHMKHVDMIDMKEPSSVVFSNPDHPPLARSGTVSKPGCWIGFVDIWIWDCSEDLLLDCGLVLFCLDLWVFDLDPGYLTCSDRLTCCNLSPDLQPVLISSFASDLLYRGL